MSRGSVSSASGSSRSSSGSIVVAFFRHAQSRLAFFFICSTSFSCDTLTRCSPVDSLISHAAGVAFVFFVLPLPLTLILKDKNLSLPGSSSPSSSPSVSSP